VRRHGLSRTTPPGRIRFPELPEPGAEEALDHLTAAWLHKATAHMIVLDNDERGCAFDAKALDEVGSLVLVDAVELEGGVVVSALQHLGEEPVDAAGRARDRRVEEDEPGPVRWWNGGGHVAWGVIYNTVGRMRVQDV